MEATHFSRAMVELGIQHIFAPSPQAKGRVERAAGTFQDRLVTALRAVGAGTIAQANAVLRDFLPRYNAQFAVHAELPEPAYHPRDAPRPVGSDPLPQEPPQSGSEITPSGTSGTPCNSCPVTERPSYAGLQVEVLEHRQPPPGAP